VSVGSALTLSPDAKVLQLESSDKNSFLHSQADYEKAVQTLLKQSVWNRNKITVNSNRITAELQQQFPELSSVSMTLPLVAHRPIVYIQPVQPALALHAANGTFILGENGKALLAASNSFANIHDLPVVNDQSGLQVRLDHQAITADDTRFIQEIVAQLSNKGYKVSSLTLPAASREVDAAIEGKPYQVKFNLQTGDARQQAGTFLATIANLEGQHSTPAQYVDVRVDGRAYYK
jgi:hypothetical protein